MKLNPNWSIGMKEVLKFQEELGEKLMESYIDPEIYLNVYCPYMWVYDLI